MSIDGVYMEGGTEYGMVFYTDGDTYTMVDPQVDIYTITGPACPKTNTYTGTLPESSHPYGDSAVCTSNAQIIDTGGAATSMCLTFDSQSEFESPSFDNLYIYDGDCSSGTLLHTFSYAISEWDGLFGGTLLEIPSLSTGNVCLCYSTDSSLTYWGYAVTEVSWD